MIPHPISGEQAERTATGNDLPEVSCLPRRLRCAALSSGILAYPLSLPHVE